MTPNNYNILITSAGRRVALVQAFKETLRSYFPTSKVMAADLNAALAPAAYVADECFAVDNVLSDDYPRQLLQICLENDIRMIIPTIDTELEILSLSKEIFLEHGIHIIVSDPEFIHTSGDKRLINTFFAKHDISIPEIYSPENLRYPCFCKPAHGSSSINTHLFKSKDNVPLALLADPQMIFMEAIDKEVYQEFTVDMYYGKDHNLKCMVPRLRMEVRGGEISKGRTVRNRIIPFLQERLPHLPGCIGCICVQLFYCPKTDDIKGIEINSRFGGGYPLSYHAGANFPEMLIREYYKNEEIEFSDSWQENLVMLRYDDAIFLNL